MHQSKPIGNVSVDKIEERFFLEVANFSLDAREGILYVLDKTPMDRWDVFRISKFSLLEDCNAT